MTTEEKAKAYDEALERARKLKEDPQGVFYEYSPKEEDTIYDYIFPELKESDDEKIRKKIIETFKNLGDGKIPVDINYADIFAWLEKQGTQSDEDMIEALRTEYEKGKADAFAQMQKDWSKEDENTIKVLMRITRKSDIIDSIIYTNSVKEKLYDWLTSIKYRIQPKQELNKNDEEKNLCERCLEASVNSKERAQILAECKSQSCWFKGY